MTAAARKLGRYDLIEQLGQGGMGEVWLARMSGAAGFEKPCLLKSVLPRLAGDRQFVERFQHEAKVLVHLQHSNIAQVLDMGDADGALYMALEYVMGVDVARLHEAVFRDGGQIPVPLAMWICHQAAEGLSYAHGKIAPDGTPLDIVHRDVSPHNLMVSYDGEVKVIDFGISRSSARAAHTQPQTVLGKIGYMAPEQVRGEEVDARTDQYALGIVLWELLTDQPYVRPGSVGEMMGSMANPTPRPLRDFRTDVPAEVEEVLQRALSAEKSARFGRIAEFAQALMGVLARRYRMPNREELSAYVREKCADQWQQHQQMLQRLSTAKPGEPVSRPRPRTNPGAETKASTPARAQKKEPLPSDTVETRAAPPEPAPTPIVSSKLLPPPTRVTPPPEQKDPLSTDEALAKVGPGRAPTLIIAVVALVLGAGAFFLVSREPAKLDTPHGPVPQVVDEPVAATPDASTAAPAAEAKPPAPAPLPLVLKGSARFIASPVPNYEISNTGGVRWTGCYAVFPDQKRGAFPSLAPGSGHGFIESRLEADAELPVLSNKVTVRCKEGNGTFSLQR